MKKILLLSLLFVLAGHSSQAQIFQWAKPMGGWGENGGNSIAADANGNIYTVGGFQYSIAEQNDTNFIPSAGLNDIFIEKSDANGNMLWFKTLGGDSNDIAISLALDAAGNLYITGNFGDTVDFDPGAAQVPLIANGLSDIFMLKMDPSGNFVWAKSIGGPYENIAKAIAVDNNANVFITGKFQDSVDFDPGAGVFKMIDKGNADIFILKLNSAGDFVWAKEMGCGWRDEGISLATDNNGNVYTTGHFGGLVDFDPNAGDHTIDILGSYEDVFVLKLDASGNFVWVDQMGGQQTLINPATDIAVDNAGNIYLTGYFDGTMDFNPGAAVFNLTATFNAYDVFVEKLNSAGAMQWTKQIEGTNYNSSSSLAVDDSGNVYTTGAIRDQVDFDPNAGTAYVTPLDNRTGIFVQKLNTNGVLQWAKDVAETGWGSSRCIAADQSGNVYLTGYFSGFMYCNNENDTLYGPGNGSTFIEKLGRFAPTGIEPLANDNFTQLYPNPAKDQLFIETNGIAIEQVNVYNSTGSLVMAAAGSSMVHGQLSIDNLPTGLYIAEIKTKDGIARKRWVKM